MSLKFADLVSATKPRAGRSPDTCGSPPDRPQAKSTSEKATATRLGASGRKVDRSGNKPTAGSRFAHFAPAYRKSEEPETAAAAGHIPGMSSFDHIPSGHGMRATAIREAAKHGFKTQAEIDAEDRKARETAKFILNAAAKARGSSR